MFYDRVSSYIQDPSGPYVRGGVGIFSILFLALLIAPQSARGGDPPVPDIATALGLVPGAISLATVSTTSGGSPVKSVDAVVGLPAEGRVIVTTGLAADSGIGNSDFLSDGLPDTTVLTLVLNVPTDASTLLIGTQFLTAENSGRKPVPQADSASISVDGGPPTGLGTVSVPEGDHPARLRAIDVAGHASVTLTITVSDAVDGSDDSAIALSGFLFTSAVPVEAAELAAALFPGETILGSTLTATSGDNEILDIVSASVLPEGVRLSTGLALDAGNGSTDLLADGFVDRTVLTVTLAVPETAVSLVYRSLFTSAETASPTPNPDQATISFSTRTGTVSLGLVDGVTTMFAPELHAAEVLGEQILTVTLVIEDAADGLTDSAIEVAKTSFSQAPIASATELANALAPIGSLVSAALDTDSGELDVIEVLGARLGTLSRSVLLTNGESIDGGAGSTDIGSDGAEDTTRLSLTLAVPTEGEIRSLVYTTRFISSEVESGGADFASVTRSRETTVVGSVGNSVTAQDPPVTRAVDVTGLSEVTVEFFVQDFDDLGTNDSGLLVSGLYFSEFEASLLENPRPADSNLQTGTYGYSKTLIGALGPMMPFGFMVHYSSAPRRTSGTMGPNWGHSYDWAVIALDGGDTLVRRGDGSIETFEPDPNDPDAFVPSHGQIFNELIKNADESYEYRTTNQIIYRFDSEGLLTSIVDENGNATTVTHDADDRVSTVLDTRNQTATFSYDAEGKLFEVTYASQIAQIQYSGDDVAVLIDPDQHTTSFTYDSEHHLLVGTDATGIAFVSNTYDEFHRVVTQLDARLKQSMTDYDVSTATHTDPLDNARITTFDPLDRQTALEVEDGGLWSYTYDENDNPASTTDPRGVTSFTTFDETGNLIEEIDGLGGLSTYTYNEENRPLTATNEIGSSISFVYNLAGNLETDLDALGNPQSYTYDERGLRTSVLDRRGNLTSFTFDGVGDMTHIMDPLGGVVEFDFDALGREIGTIDQNGNATTLTVDAVGRTTSTTDASDATIFYDYDEEGRLLSEIDQLGRATTFDYTPSGRLLRVTDPLGNSIESTYDDNDRLSTIEDPRGDTTQIHYDSVGRISGTTDPMGGTIAAFYDIAGRRTEIEDPRGNSIHFAYDDLGRVIAETDPLGNMSANDFDAAGRLTLYTNARGQSIGLGYDAAARLTSVARLDHTITYTLDENGNRTATMGRNGRETLRDFDALDRVTTVTDVNGNTLTYTYDPVGNLTSITYSDGKIVSYTYDALNRMTSVTDWDGRQTVYTWDAASQLTSATLPDGSVVSYIRDEAGRLIGIDDTAPSGQTTFETQYTLDAAGLRIAETANLPLEAPITSGSRSFTVDAANQIVAEGSDTFTYDADGNLVQGVIGRLPVELEYDETNRLTAMGASCYEYDDDGLRIEATVNHRTVRYVQDTVAGLPRVLEEHDEYGNVVARYVYGIGLISRHQLEHDDDDDDDGDDDDSESDSSGLPEGPSPSSSEPYDDEPSEHVSVYHFDSRGSTLALTNLNGSVTDRYAYDPYGLVVAREGETTNPYTYNGRDGVIDDGNGLYFMRTRYYEPRLMRFISRDGLVAGAMDDSQSLNRYMYARGNPIHGIDPSGAWFGLDDAVAVVGGAVAGVAGQFVADVITVAGGGEWSGWEEYVGAAVEGAVFGETLLYTGNPVLAGAAGAAAGNATTQGLRIATGKQSSFDWAEFGTEVALGAALGGVGGKATKAGAGKQLKNLRKTARAWRKSMGTNLEFALQQQFKKQAKKFTKDQIKDGIKSGIKEGIQGIPAVESQINGFKAAAWGGAQSVRSTITPTAIFQWYGTATSRKGP